MNGRRGEGTALYKMSLAFSELGDEIQAVAHANVPPNILARLEDPGAGELKID
jgi:hypothetical protein